MLKSIIPSMFHRRLLLLLALVIIASTPIVAQMARLTLTRSAQARVDAESKMIRRQWTPTVRGRILDRKDRVLARDRASYDIRLDYSVLAGEWPAQAAPRLARRAAGAVWRDLSPLEREARIATIRSLLEAHLERGWDLLSETTGISRPELDTRRAEVVARVERMYRSIVDRRRQEEIEALRQREQPITSAEQEALERRVTQPIQEQLLPHVLIPSISDSIGFALRTLEDRTAPIIPGQYRVAGETGEVVIDPSEPIEIIPTLRVADAGDRQYPMENMTVDIDASTLPGPVKGQGKKQVDVQGVGVHILGWIRNEVRKEDVDLRRAILASDPEISKALLTADGRDRGEYQALDRVGHVGIEASQESLLRGLRGTREVRLDSGDEKILPADPGRDVRLTIDIMLQAKVQAAMTPSLGLAVVQGWHHQDSPYMPEGTKLNGAAVVLDIDTGDILALVSTPTFTRDEMRTNPSAVFANDIDVPFLNRAIAKSYTPGSIVKALVLSESITHGNFQTSQRIPCTGHLLPNHPDMYRCWIYKRFGTTHSAFLGHDLGGAEALSVSCNIFFYTLGKRLGPEGISQTFSDFGVGEAFGLGIGQEFAGQIGTPSKTPGAPPLVRPEDAIQMGIGQGPIVWTPLHAANSYATLVRGGVRIAPKLIASASRPSPREIALTQESISESMEGLRLAVNGERGTGRVLNIDDHDEPIFNTPGVDIWGKTGTADAPDQILDPDGPDGPQQPRIVRAGDHSWFVVVVGPKGGRARYAVAVVMDFAGSGAKVSGPICNQIIHALVDEGYLSGAAS